VRRISTTITTLLWIIAALPLLGMLMIYGYSDQAPTALRSFTIALDGMFGSPIWSLIKPAP
jgi:hypothetical protein